MSYRYKYNCSWLFAFSAILFSGCAVSNSVEAVVKQFDAAIEQFQEFRKQIDQDVQQAFRNVDRFSNGLDEKFRRVIDDGTIGRLAADVAGAGSDELKTHVIMLESRMLNYVDSVIRALRIKQEEMRLKRQGIPRDVAEIIIAEVIAGVKEIEPFIGTLNSKTLEYRPQGSARVLVAGHDVEFGGFALGGRTFQIVGQNHQGECVWTAPPDSLTANTPFRITFVAKKSQALPGSVEKLILIWAAAPSVELASILLKPAPAIVAAPLISQVTVRFRGDQVKYPTVAFSTEMTIVNGPKQTIPLLEACGRGDVWEKDSYVAYQSPVKVETPLDENSTIILDIAMRSDLGGPVTHTFSQVTGFPPQEYFHSGTYTPRRATREQLQRFGFVQRGLKNTHTKWDLRDPLRMVASDWSGHVQMSVVHGGKVIQFDESRQITFKQGKPKSGKLALRLLWKGNGILMPHHE